MKPHDVKTIAELHDLRFDDILPFSHIIIGANGKCMCGIYDGQPWTCSEIIKLRFPVARDCGMEAGDGSDY